MSYSTDTKKKLISLKLKGNCCRRAFASGIIFGTAMSGAVEKEPLAETPLFAGNEKELSDAVSGFMSSYFKADCHVTKYFNCGKQRYLVSTSSPKANLALKEITCGDYLSASDHFKCDLCRGVFVRGVYVASALLSDPSKELHLEFIAKDPTLAAAFSRLLAEVGFPSSGKNRIYYKSTENVAGLLAYIEAKNESFEVMNLQIERQIRNEENRKTNCDASNILRSVSASMLQLDAITYIMAEDALEKLPPELIITAKLRLENPDATLSELARLHEPVITKSGLNHRLAKLTAFSEKLKADKAKA